MVGRGLAGGGVVRSSQGNWVEGGGLTQQQLQRPSAWLAGGGGSGEAKEAGREAAD